MKAPVRAWFVVTPALNGTATVHVHLILPDIPFANPEQLCNVPLAKWHHVAGACERRQAPCPKGPAFLQWPVAPANHQQLSVTYAVLFITVVAMLGPGVPSTCPGTPESVREYVWPGRTVTTAH